MIAFILLTFTLTPLLVFAAPSNFSEFVYIFVDLIAAIIPVLIGLAVLTFLWGLAKFILKAGDTKSRDEGKKFIMWGVIALFAMVSVWGLIVFAKNEFEFGGGTLFPLLPTD